MKFVDRNKEIAKINRALRQPDPTFIVIYGRRRLGKSTLLKHVIKPADVYFMADQSNENLQRAMLAKVIAEKFEGFDAATYPDWDSLFRQINYRAAERFVLCLDEFPLLVNSCPSLPSTLQRLIDSNSLKFDLVVCGSSQQMMRSMVLDASSPLYQRAHMILNLKPIPARYLQEYFACSAQQAVEEYAVWGGVPRYWELRAMYPSLIEAIDEQIFDSDGTLYDEPGRLFADDFNRQSLAMSLLSLVGNGVNRVSEMAARLKKKATDLSGPLARLIEFGYLERQIPFGENPRNNKRSYYRISDPFMRFFFRFVTPNRSLIGLGRTQLLNQLLTDNFNDFAAEQWEHLCQQAVTGNRIMGTTWNVASRWWGGIKMGTHVKQVELDLVAESIDHSKLLIGECKWTGHENASALLASLKERSQGLPVAKDHQVVYALFLKNEPDDGMREEVVLPADVVADFKE